MLRQPVRLVVNYRNIGRLFVFRRIGGLQEGELRERSDEI